MNSKKVNKENKISFYFFDMRVKKVENNQRQFFLNQKLKKGKHEDR